jgi:putative ABC transport system substrate-binding protein
VAARGARAAAGDAPGRLPARRVAYTYDSTRRPDVHGSRAERQTSGAVARDRSELHRVAILANPAHPGEHLERGYTQEYGRQLGLATDYFATTTREELERVFATIAKDPPQAISLFADGFAIQYRQSIIDFGLSRRVPVISGWPVFARAGAICTYGPQLTSSYQRMAYYVDRILKGTPPSDLPIEQPTKFELVVNLKTAKPLGLDIPATVLARADEVIE